MKQLKFFVLALDSVTQLVGCCPLHQKMHMPGLWARSQVGGVQEAADRVSLSPCPPL